MPRTFDQSDYCHSHDESPKNLCSRRYLCVSRFLSFSSGELAQLSDSVLGGRVAFTYPDFVRYQLGRMCVIIALEMQSVAIGWQVYEITHRPLDLGLVGLAQFLPGVLLFLVAGHAADRHDRRRLLLICYFGFMLCSGLLLVLTLRHILSVHLIYAVLLLLGVV